MNRIAVACLTVAACAGEAPTGPAASPTEKTAVADAETPSPAREPTAVPEAEPEEDAAAIEESLGAKREAKEGGSKEDAKLPAGKSSSATKGLGGGMLGGDKPIDPDRKPNAQSKLIGEDAALIAELDGLERQLTGMGVTLAHDQDAEFALARTMNTELELSAATCTKVCTVSESICSLETKICAMVTNHPDDPRYSDACARAKSDCLLGTAACTACRE